MRHQIDTDHGFQRAENGLLDGVGQRRIALRVVAEAARQNQHAGMFAAAIVVDTAGRVDCAGLGDHGRLVARPLRPAGQQLDRKLEPVQQPPDGIDMFRLAVMAGADQRHFGRHQALCLVDPLPRFRQRDGLKRFHRGTRKNETLDIAKPDKNRAVGVTQRDIDGVTAFLGTAACHRDMKRVIRDQGKGNAGNGHGGTSIIIYRQGVAGRRRRHNDRLRHGFLPASGPEA